MTNHSTIVQNETHYAFFQETFKKGTLSIVASRPGIGRLKWMTDNMLVAHALKKKVHLLSLDIPSDTLRERLISTYNGVPYVEEMIPVLSLHYQVHTRPKDIENLIIDQKATSGLDILFIDFLELILCDEGSELTHTNDFDKVMKRLHALAVKHGIAIILGKMFARNVDFREDKYPVLDDFFIKKSRLSDFENIIGLYRDEVYDMDTTQSNIIENIVFKSPLNQGIPFKFSSEFIHHFSN